MLGHLSDDSKTLVEVWATENAWIAETADFYQNTCVQEFCPLRSHQAPAEVPHVELTSVMPVPKSELVTTKTRRYTIAPIVFLQAQSEARDRRLDIIGIYHSHPDNCATPSEFDRVYAWPQYSYIIVSVQQGKACDLNSWSLDDNHRFQPEEMIIV